MIDKCLEKYRIYDCVLIKKIETNYVPTSDYHKTFIQILLHKKFKDFSVKRL